MRTSDLPLITSPADEADWREYIETNPDITDVIVYIQNHFNVEGLFDIQFSSKEPEDVFEYQKLSSWARENDWVQELSDYDDDEIARYAKNNFNPDDVFTFKRLRQWAEENGFEKMDE